MRDCEVDWATDAEDEDGEAFHRCGRPEGHEGEWHWCSSHVCCWPFCTDCDEDDDA